MLTQTKLSVRETVKTSLLLLSTLHCACHGKFYIGKFNEETNLVDPPELLQQEEILRSNIRRKIYLNPPGPPRCPGLGRQEAVAGGWPSRPFVAAEQWLVC